MQTTVLPVGKKAVDEKRLLCAVAEDLSVHRRTAADDLAGWDEPDAETLARTGPDAELAGLTEHIAGLPSTLGLRPPIHVAFFGRFGRWDAVPYP